MKLNARLTNPNIQELVDKFHKGTLIVDQSYQRRKVWGEKDQVRLIETILLGYIIPELYFWDAEVDPMTGVTITHIVDGQQRISAIVDFIEGQFKLKGEYLIEEESKVKYSDKMFSELTTDEKLIVWKYSLTVVHIENADIETIKKMFSRLNLTEYTLNPQERRHVVSGKFAGLAVELSELEVWSKYKLFNIREIRRMGDVEFCSTLILLARRGIVDQTTPKALNEAYNVYNEKYTELEDDRQLILSWIKSLEDLIGDEPDKAMNSFLKKKTQLYTVFCLIDYMNQKSIKINEKIVGKFKEFVNVYNNFKNSTDLHIEQGTSEEKISKYKLAASEGVNKLKNRIIRFQIMKEILLGE